MTFTLTCKTGRIKYSSENGLPVNFEQRFLGIKLIEEYSNSLNSTSIASFDDEPSYSNTHLPLHFLIQSSRTIFRWVKSDSSFSAGGFSNFTVRANTVRQFL